MWQDAGVSNVTLGREAGRKGIEGGVRENGVGTHMGGYTMYVQH